MSFLLPKPKPKLCPVCGVAPVKRGVQTCSAKCGYELRKSKTRFERTCHRCGVAYTATRQHLLKYCSLRCYRADKGVRPAFVQAKCAKCGSTFTRTSAALKRRANVFCSRECWAAYNRGDKHAHFRGDKDPNRGANWNRLAAEIRKRDGYTCRRCGRCEFGMTEKLSVDHVRPWRSFDDKALANHPDNLVSLCRGCHTFKTVSVEAAWLRGDVLAWKQWVASLNLQSAVKFGWSA